MAFCTDDDARKFLTRVLPWADSDGWFNIHWDPKSEGHGWHGESYRNIEGMLACVDRLKPYNDVFACMSSQRVEGQRSARNARTLKALALDIDVSARGYRSTAEALAALDAFVRRASLPPPTMIVTSGISGVHVYWTLSEALARDEWLPLARALSNATVDLGLLNDRTAITNAAQLLRIPGTFNVRRRPERLPVLLHPSSAVHAFSCLGGK
jgi:hypothetical protein